MEILHEPFLDERAPCPYLPDREKQLVYFLAHDLDEEETASILSMGWRRFGIQYFRPACPDCRLCIPLRVRTDTFTPSRSQRRVLRKGETVEARFGPSRFESRIFEIFAAHSATRFSQPSVLEDFLMSFYTPACPSLQSEYFVDGELAGVGFLDRGRDGLSSVYFAFDPRFGDFSLGTLSVLKEIGESRRLGLPYYYLGYFVPGSPRMAYKDCFHPREYFDWRKESWKPAGDGQ